MDHPVFIVLQILDLIVRFFQGGLGVGGRAGMVGVPGTSASGGQRFLDGRPVGSSSLQYQGQIGGGVSTFVSGSGPQSVSSKQFAGIKKSSSGKSTY